MARYHIGKGGMPAVCRAEKGKCPLGGFTGEENHFDSKEEAQKEVDKRNLIKFSNPGKPRAKMEHYDWNKFTPRTKLTGEQRQHINEDIIQLNDKIQNDQASIVGVNPRFHQYMQIAYNAPTATTNEALRNLIAKNPIANKDFEDLPAVNKYAEGNNETFKNAVQDWAYTKMNYDRDGSVNNNPDYDRTHFDDVDWTHVKYKHNLTSFDEDHRTDELSNINNEDANNIKAVRNKVLNAKSIDDVTNALYSGDGDSALVDKYLSLKGHKEIDFYRDNKQFDEYKSSMSDFLYKEAKKTK